MTSTGKTVSAVLITAIVFGAGAYCLAQQQSKTELAALQKENDELLGEVEDLTPSEENAFNFAIEGKDIGFTFELPEGYGVVEDQEGEGQLQFRYYLGQVVPENGPVVIRSSLSIADYLTVIPSYDDSIVSLEDWREQTDVYDGEDATETKEMTIDGVNAVVSTFPAMGETWLVQFVKDGTYYELHVDGTLEGEAVAQLLETFAFTK